MQRSRDKLRPIKHVYIIARYMLQSAPPLAIRLRAQFSRMYGPLTVNRDRREFPRALRASMFVDRCVGADFARHELKRRDDNAHQSQKYIFNNWHTRQRRETYGAFRHTDLIDRRVRGGGKAFCL